MMPVLLDAVNPTMYDPLYEWDIIKIVIVLLVLGLVSAVIFTVKLIKDRKDNNYHE